MKKLNILAAAAVLALSFCLPAVVSAQTDSTEVVEKARKSAQELRKSKDARIEEIKQEVANRKAAIKKDLCEKQVQRLNTRITNVSRNANTIKGVIDKSYARVQEFYASGQLTTPDYESLVAAIELAKANAETSLEAVSNYGIEIDCENENAGEQLDAFRSAANKAKEDLKAYRKAVVDLIKSLKSANAIKTNDTNQGGNGAETNE